MNFLALFAGSLVVLDVCQATPAFAAEAFPLIEKRPLPNAIREFNHLHSKDAKGREQRPLSKSELIACLLWKMSAGELPEDVIRNFFVNKDGKDEYVLPADWKLSGGLVRHRSDLGTYQTWEVWLETNGLSKPLLIRQTPNAPPSSFRDPSQSRDDKPGSVPLSGAIESFNTSFEESQLALPLGEQAFVHGADTTLTQDQVLAAIAHCRTLRDQLQLDDETFALLGEIARTHRVPSEARFEFELSAENSIGQRFFLSSIRMLIPRVDKPGQVHTIPIRRRFLSLDRSFPGATHWSLPGSNGIQAGVRLVSREQTFQHDQVVEIEFLYRSVFGEEVSASLPTNFRFRKVTGIRLIEVGDRDGSDVAVGVRTTIGSTPIVLRKNRMQLCIDPATSVRDGVTWKAITKPGANHYVRFVVPNPGLDSQGEDLEIRDRLFFHTALLKSPEARPLFEGHYYWHWGTSAPGHRRPRRSTPDPDFIDPFRIGVSLGPADIGRIPTYYASGFEVIRVAPHSPAEIAGIEEGDIILAWEGHQVHGTDAARPFRSYNAPNNHWRERLEEFDRLGRMHAMGSSSTKMVLLDHRTGEVVDVAPAFGLANGSSKSHGIRRALERKFRRAVSSGQNQP